MTKTDIKRQLITKMTNALNDGVTSMIFSDATPDNDFCVFFQRPARKFRVADVSTIDDGTLRVSGYIPAEADPHTIMGSGLCTISLAGLRRISKLVNMRLMLAK